MLYFEVQTKKKKKMSRVASIQTWGSRGQNRALIWALQFPLALLSRFSGFKWALLSTLAWLILPGVGPAVKGAWQVTACKSYAHSILLWALLFQLRGSQTCQRRHQQELRSGGLTVPRHWGAPSVHKVAEVTVQVLYYC